jgi:hypothetical protein
MAQSKYIKVDKNVLLEYIYDSTNLITENYSVISNLNEGTRSFISTTTNNLITNNVFYIDRVIRKLTKYDLSNYNFLQKQDYNTPAIKYDKIRLHFPVSFTFSGYYGFYLNTNALGYTNKLKYDLSNFIFDYTDGATSSLLKLETTFLYDEQLWGKYIDIVIPSTNAVSSQRYVDSTQNIPLVNSINKNLTNSNGLSYTSPVFIGFSFIYQIETVFGRTYYYINDLFKTSVTSIPEYETLAVNIEESTQGDYFEIYGSYNNSNENLDDFIAELKAKGKGSIRIDYIVSLFEENLLVRTQTFTVYENFSEKLLYRPVISTSNTTAAIDVEMRVVDLVDESVVSRYTSIGLTNELFKYGRNLTRINLDNAYKPKIYVPRQGNISINQSANSNPDINITKVNYPLLYDKYKILVGASNADGSGFKSNGLLNIVITPFDNVMKFYIAKSINNDGSIVPFDLTDMLTNATMLIAFRSESDYMEKEIWYEAGGQNGNDYKNGIIVFKVNETDINTIKKIKNNNNNFYLILKSLSNRTLFYSGKFNLYEKLTFIETAVAQPITVTTTPPDTPKPAILQAIEPINKIIVFTKTTESEPKPSSLSGSVNITSNVGEFIVISTQYDVDAWTTLQTSYSLDSNKNGKVVPKFNNNGDLIGYYDVGSKIEKYGYKSISIPDYSSNRPGAKKLSSMVKTNSNVEEWIRTDSIQTAIVQKYYIKAKDNSGFAKTYVSETVRGSVVLSNYKGHIADNNEVSVYDYLNYNGSEYVQISVGDGRTQSQWVKKEDVMVVSPTTDNSSLNVSISDINLGRGNEPSNDNGGRAKMANVSTTSLASAQVNTTIEAKGVFENWLISQGIKYQKIYVNAFMCSDTNDAQRIEILKQKEVDTVFDVNDDNLSTNYMQSVTNPKGVTLGIK